MEDGVRIDSANSAGLNLSCVVAPTVLNTGKEYLMVYGGIINQAYSKEKVPSKDTHLLLWATSKDGLTFEKKGIALDSRNDVFKGWQDGPELVEWENGVINYSSGAISVFTKALLETEAFQIPSLSFTDQILMKMCCFLPVLREILLWQR